MKEKKRLPFWLQKIIFLFSILGPGLITASADNDAPGIATYSMVGSTYGYSFLWMIILITIGEVVIQETAARMGAVTGKGTADLIRERFGVKITAAAMVCLFVANLGTTVAQFAGIAAAGEIWGISKWVSVPIAGFLISWAILKGDYKVVEKFLLFLSVASLSYVATVIILKPDWGVILQSALRPKVQLDATYILALLAVVGTTLTPWGIFYLQASVADKGVNLKEYAHTRMDVMFGAAWGNIISAFIIITTAVTLYSRGIRVEDAKQAALALEPLAGVWSGTLFAIGLLGASLLAVSVLPLATTYAMSEAFGFERGLNRSVREAPSFYFIFTAITLLSMLIVLLPGMPLFSIMILSQSVNGILLPVILILVLILANDKVLMGTWKNSLVTNILSVAMTILIVGITIVLFAQSFFPDLLGSLT